MVRAGKLTEADITLLGAFPPSRRIESALKTAPSIKRWGLADEDDEYVEAAD